MPKVSDAYRAARRDEILDAAQRCFSRTGYRGTTMADIIAESGLSAGAIYGYFPSKRELFAAVARRTLGLRLEEVERAGGDGRPLAPGEVLGVVLRGMRDHFDTRVLVQLWADAAIHEDVRADIAEPLDAVRAALERAVRPWFAAHPEHGRDPDAALARFLPIMFGTAQGFMMGRELFDDFDDEAYLDGLAELLPH